MSDQKELAMKWAKLISHTFFQYYKLIAVPKYGLSDEAWNTLGLKSIQGFNVLLFDYFYNGVIIDRVTFEEIYTWVSISLGKKPGSTIITFHTGYSLDFYELLVLKQANNSDWIPGHNIHESMHQDYPYLLRTIQIKNRPDKDMLMLEIPPLEELQSGSMRLKN